MKKNDEQYEFKQLIPFFLPFIPNSDQNSAIELLTNFIFNDESRSLFILKGYAGTGKTNLISALTKALPSIRWRSVLLAPTGRAAKVLSNYSQRQAHTIHKKIFRKEFSNDGIILPRNMISHADSRICRNHCTCF